MIESRSKEVQQFWEESKSNLGIQAHEYHSCTLSDPDALDPSVESLDLSGQPRLIGARQKRGTAHMLMDFERSNIQRRKIGDYWILLNDDLSPMFLVQVSNVEVIPFNKVPQSWAEVEGEGDSSLKWWQDAHYEYYTRQCKKWGISWQEDHPIVCETWKLVAAPNPWTDLSRA